MSAFRNLCKLFPISYHHPMNPLSFGKNALHFVMLDLYLAVRLIVSLLHRSGKYTVTFYWDTANGVTPFFWQRVLCLTLITELNCMLILWKNTLKSSLHPAPKAQLSHPSPPNFRKRTRQHWRPTGYISGVKPQYRIIFQPGMKLIASSIGLLAFQYYAEDIGGLIPGVATIRSAQLLGPWARPLTPHCSRGYVSCLV